MFPSRFLALGITLLANFIPAFSQEFDESFGIQLKGLAKVYSIDETPQGYIVAAGEFDFYNGEPSGRVLLLDANGNFAPGFQKVFTDDAVKKVCALPDGKILIQGSFSRVNGNEAHYLARLNADGSFDPTFTSKAPIPVADFALQSNGKIIVTPKQQASAKVYRLNSNGSLDQAFNTVQITSITDCYLMQIDNEDRIILSDGLRLMRLTPNGTGDNTFEPSIHFNNGSISTMKVQDDGKLLVAGTFGEDSGLPCGMFRLNANGTLDETFHGCPPSNNDQITAIEITRDGQLLAGGNSSRIFKFSADGNSREEIATLYPGSIFTLKQSHNNEIIAGGWFRYINGVEQASLAKLNVDYSFNSQFKFRLDDTLLWSNHMIITPKGEILLSGFDPRFINAGNKSTSLIRITKEGIVDDSYKTDFPDNSRINAVEVQHNNMVLVSGWFYINGSYKHFLRLKKDGSIDPTFNLNGSNILPGKIRFNGSNIYIAGGFTSFNGTTSPGFAILDHHGELKHVSGLGVKSNVINFDFQTDGKIIVMGHLVMPDGSTKGMARLLKDGTLDPSFAPQELYDDRVIKIDKENRIYIGGYPDLRGRILTRYNPDGHLDASFSGGSYFGSNTDSKYISLIDILPSNKIMVGGLFNTYKGIQTNGLIIFEKDGNNFSIPATTLGPTTTVTHVLYHGSRVYVGGRLSFDDGRKIISLGKINLDPKDFIVPDHPKDARLSDVQTDQTTTLEWTDDTDAEDGYEIERFSAVEGTYVKIATTPSSWGAFMDSTNVENESRFRIRPYNEKAKSEYRYIGQQMTPSSPADLSLSESNDNISLTWIDQSDNESGFTIERSVNSDSFVEYAQVDADVTNYHDPDIIAGNVYTYRISAFNSFGLSSYTEASLSYHMTPFSPTDLALSESNGTITLSWTDQSSNESGFTIERSVNSGLFIEYAQADADVTHFDDLSIFTGGTYSYRVKAFNNFGSSNYTDATITLVITNVEDASESSYYASPNPASHYLDIHGPENIKSIFCINSLGQRLLLGFTQPDVHVYRVNISEIPDGLYWFTVITPEGNKCLKIVKHQ